MQSKWEVAGIFATLAVAAFVGATAARPRWVASLFVLTGIFVLCTIASGVLLPSDVTVSASIASAPAPPVTKSAPASAQSNSVGNVYGNSGIIAPGATGNISQQIGQLPPPPRVMTPEQMAAATTVLSTARKGSTVRLNYSAENGVDEVEKFYAQVHTVFVNSRHWRLIPSRIGKSMSFMDGGTLTGEGVRCTSSSNAGKVAIKAMRLAGFSCIGKARDWNVTDVSRPPSDVIISIGSRFVPSE